MTRPRPPKRCQVEVCAIHRYPLCATHPKDGSPPKFQFLTRNKDGVIHGYCLTEAEMNEWKAPDSTEIYAAPLW